MNITYNHSTNKYCRTGDNLCIHKDSGFHQYYPTINFMRSSIEMWVKIKEEDENWIYFNDGITKNKISK